MDLYLLRHAESEGNATGKYATEQSGLLSEEGKRQADQLVRHLLTLEFDQIVVSPLARTLQTIVPYLQHTRRRAEIWPELAEIGNDPVRGPTADNWSSKPFVDLAGLPDVFDFHDGRPVMPIADEPIPQARHRVQVVRNRLLERYNRKPKLLVVTHGHFLQALIAFLLDIRQPLLISHQNCNLTLLRHEEGWWKLEYTNRPISNGQAV
ncbi:MAG: histidine phosphatase family protein [Phycisphaeraceae bacterium]|nr:histidine phosphatase family protein [Phycisphaeraceae bacterium]